VNEPNAEAIIRATESKLNKAFESNDVNAISEFLSEEWTILESATGLSNRSQFLSAIQSGKLTHDEMSKKIHRMNIKDNFAIVVSKGINKGKYLDRVFNSDNWITNVYVFENNRWLCLMTTEVPVSPLCD